MESEHRNTGGDNVRPPTDPRRASLIDWFYEGESKQVVANGAVVTVRFVGRKGRRGRIVIEAPAGAEFSTLNQQ